VVHVCQRINKKLKVSGSVQQEGSWPLVRIGGSDRSRDSSNIMAMRTKLIHHPHEADGVLRQKEDVVSGLPSCSPIQASSLSI